MMRTRSTVLTLILLLVPFSIVGADGAGSDRPEAARPDIVFLFTDDQRHDALGVVDPTVHTPHLDRPAREAFLERYEASEMPLPPTWEDDLAGKPPYLRTARSRAQALRYGYDDPDRIRRHVRRYRAAVTQVDAALGRVIDAVDRLGRRERTWFLFMGDNGWQIAEHGFTSKVLAYEESIRVPMVIAGPGGTARVDRRIALNIDLPATILDIAGVERPSSMHGRSLLSPAADGWRTDFVYEAPTPVLGVHPVMAVRDARWKLIRTYDPEVPGRVAFTELYDLATDPTESRNVAVDPLHAERVARMAERIAEHERMVRGRGGRERP